LFAFSAMECSPEYLPRDTMVPDVEDVVVELVTVFHLASRDVAAVEGHYAACTAKRFCFVSAVY
jgi:hypothetical protein